MLPKIVAVDFDGVIGAYTHWKGLGQFGAILPDCREELQKLRDAGWYIIIFTTRGADSKALIDYLTEQKVPWDSLNQNHPETPPNNSNRKVLADVYIDDRAILFGGKWDGISERVMQFKPWYKVSGQRPSFGIELFGYQADQLALAVPTGQLNKYVSHFSTICINSGNWIFDSVEAIASVNKNDYKDKFSFFVNLAFNYNIFGFEFELLEENELSPFRAPHIQSIVSGAEIKFTMLSHIGFHVPNIKKAMAAFESHDCEIYAFIETIKHSSCQHRYNYAFANTKKWFGFDSKLICRIAE